MTVRNFFKIRGVPIPVPKVLDAEERSETFQLYFDDALVWGIIIIINLHNIHF